MVSGACDSFEPWGGHGAGIFFCSLAQGGLEQEFFACSLARGGLEQEFRLLARSSIRLLQLLTSLSEASGSQPFLPPGHPAAATERRWGAGATALCPAPVLTFCPSQADHCQPCSRPTLDLARLPPFAVLSLVHTGSPESPPSNTVPVGRATRRAGSVRNPRGIREKMGIFLPGS